MKRSMFLALAVLCGIASVCAQTVLVKKSRPQGRIIAADSLSQKSAELLNLFVGHISGTEIPVVTNSVHPKKGDVLIRRSADSRVHPDGFHISTASGYLLIEGGSGKGSDYAVTTILERWLGCNYWSEFDFEAPESDNINLPFVDIIENPAFDYRQSQNYALSTDPVYRTWMRLEEPREVFAGGLWVHTFDRLLPSAVYGKDHPEYYAYFGGSRHPGKASQWCLTNDEVFDIVVQRIDSIFKANPGKNIISVSQNDGNHTNCTCPTCAELDSIEGSPSGSLIHFLNRLAERFLDKQISTLAYLYTMHPPRHVKPRPNVNIMLCDIDCYREVPLPYNASGRDFLKALTGWSAITDNIFVWDYGINFDGTSTPFPNFHIIQPNIRTFRDNNVKMHFSQIAGYRGGDMSELRTWLISKLMWNPDADVDSLTRTFIDGYYGEAAPQIYQYLKLLEGALLGSQIPLWIYDSPVTHKDGMLNPMLRLTYNRLFDEAEAAVAADSALLARVRRSRLPLQYSELELARTDPDKNIPELIEKLELFEQRSKEFGLKTINERNNSPLDYVALYRERYLPKINTNLAAGASVEYSVPIPAPYDRLGAAALTDGLYGGATYKDSWVGWEGTDVSLTLDMHEIKTVNSVTSDFLHQLGAWIMLPRSVSYSFSTDGVNFSEPVKIAHPEDNEPKVKFVEFDYILPSPTEARYIRLDIEATKQCPHWHGGVGNPCWFFIDEISAN